MLEPIFEIGSFDFPYLVYGLYRFFLIDFLLEPAYCHIVLELLHSRLEHFLLQFHIIHFPHCNVMIPLHSPLYQPLLHFVLDECLYGSRSNLLHDLPLFHVSQIIEHALFLVTQLYLLHKRHCYQLHHEITSETCQHSYQPTDMGEWHNVSVTDCGH